MKALFFLVGIIYIAALVFIGSRFIDDKPAKSRIKLTLYGNILCTDESNKCFHVQPNKNYCFEFKEQDVCFLKPEPYN